MRIAIDARMYGPEQFSGIGNYIKNLTDNLFEIDKNNEYIIFLNDKYHSILTTQYSQNFPNVKTVLVNIKHYSYAEQYKLPLEFRKEKFDLIHYPHFNSPILYNKKCLCTIHDTTPLIFPGHKAKSGFRRWAYKKVFHSTLQKSEQIIAVSNKTKQDLIEKMKVDPDKIKVIHEGVDEQFSQVQNYAIIKEIKNKFRITKPYLFFIGVWRNHKNVEGLVHAFNLLKKDNKFTGQLVLGGRQDLHYTKVQEEINKSPYKKDIITTDYIADEDLPALYSGAELFVIPSFIEGFGLIGLEAQACGCPVVASQTTSLPEILDDSALYFDPHNITEMATTINELTNSKSKQTSLIEKGLKNAKKYTWRKCAKQTLALYNQLAD